MCVSTSLNVIKRSRLTGDARLLVLTLAAKCSSDNAVEADFATVARWCGMTDQECGTAWREAVRCGELATKPLKTKRWRWEVTT